MNWETAFFLFQNFLYVFLSWIGTEFCQYFSCIYWEDYIFLLHYSSNVVIYIDFFFKVKATFLHYHNIMELSKQTHINHRFSPTPNFRNYSVDSNKIEVPTSFWRDQNDQKQFLSIPFSHIGKLKIGTCNHVSIRILLDKNFLSVF